MNLIGQLVGPLGRETSPTQGLYLHRTTQRRKMQTYIHASRRIWTHDPSVRAAKDSTCLRPVGHWDRLLSVVWNKILYAFLFSLMRATWPSNFMLLDFMMPIDHNPLLLPLHPLTWATRRNTVCGLCLVTFAHRTRDARDDMYKAEELKTSDTL
jgi:hypothetical protein